jgi:tetratricopeptide (TPR) repeat protein
MVQRVFTSEYEFSMKEKRMRKVSFFLLIAVLWIMPAFAADDLGEFNRRLAAAKDKGEQANVYKDLGNYHADANSYEKAADAYLKALPVLRDQLPEDQRTQIAIYLSWGGKLGEATTELQLLLKRFPNNWKARSHLAKVLLWSGNPDGALAEAERVLASQAADRDSLLVKAEVLRIRGELDRAITLYEGLLKGGEDFDTRLGMAFAYFQKGDFEQAKTQTARLKPVYPYQKQELDRLNADIDKSRAARQAELEAVGDQADRLKKEGDRLADGEKYGAAAVQYEKALAISRAFPAADRLRMAQVLSWGGKHALARSLLEELVAKDPGNLEARVGLMRVFTWTGEFDAALRQADEVLAAAPANRDARLGKANALRYRGFHRKADTYYHALLKEAEDFDVRSGMTYGLIGTGRRTEADRSMAVLKPQFEYQKSEYAALQRDRNWTFRPRVYGGASFYYDNDDNRVTTLPLGTQFFLGDWRTNIDYSRLRAQTEATGPTVDGVTLPLNVGRETDYVQLSTYARMPWYGGLGGGIGLSDGTFFTWNARADVDVLWGNIGASVANEAYNYTAELIDKNIRSLAFSGWIVQRPTDRITVNASHTYREYSDSNGSHDTQAGIAYLFWRNPSMSVGYRFRHMDFRRQSQGGYFDPDDYQAHSIFLSLGFDARPFYGYVSPYFGYQDYNRNDVNQSGNFGGVGGLLGYWINDRAAVEGFGEWGNSMTGPSLGAGAGWYYYVVGARIIVSF